MFYGSFFSDDFTWLWHGQLLDNDVWKILTYRVSSFYSPALNAFYSVFFSLFGYATWIYFLAGLVVHTLVSFLTGVLTYQLTKKTSASIVALCFVAVAGSAYEPIVWIAANLHSIATVFILASVIAYNTFLESKRAQHACLTFIFVLCAFGTKEIAVITPFLLVVSGFYHFSSKKKIEKSWLHWALIASVGTVTMMYIVQQYIWQHSALTVSEGWWHPNILSIVKLPFLIADLFLPVFTMVGTTGAILTAMCVCILVLLGLVRNRTIGYGLLWILITALPTLFFSTVHWWGPLASRYAYLPRVGAGIIAGAIFTEVFKFKKYSMACYIMLLLVNACSWIYIVSRDYPYVYASGRTLQKAVRDIGIQGIRPVYIAPYRPFESNVASIVGAFRTLTALGDEDIIFLHSNDHPNYAHGSAELIWDEAGRTYRVNYY